ncbi:unnamed protein product [Gadus morhua 'NCC']
MTEARYEGAVAGGCQRWNACELHTGHYKSGVGALRKNRSGDKGGGREEGVVGRADKINDVRWKGNWVGGEVGGGTGAPWLGENHQLNEWVRRMNSVCVCVCVCGGGGVMKGHVILRKKR